AASHIRLYRESPESEFAKITYRVSDEVAISDELKEALEDTSTLVKTEDPNAFDLEEDRRIEITGRRYRRTYPLLNGVRSIKFEYYRKQDDRWFREWDSLNREFLNQYPDIIRMTIVVVGPSRLFYEGIHLFKPEMPFYGLHPSY